MVQGNPERIETLGTRHNLRAAILKKYPLEASEVTEVTENSEKIEGEDAERNDPRLHHWRVFLARQQSKQDDDTESLSRVGLRSAPKLKRYTNRFKVKLKIHVNGVDYVNT